jgi:hypothetical protein
MVEGQDPGVSSEVSREKREVNGGSHLVFPLFSGKIHCYAPALALRMSDRAQLPEPGEPAGQTDPAPGSHNLPPITSHF